MQLIALHELMVIAFVTRLLLHWFKPRVSSHAACLRSKHLAQITPTASPKTPMTFFAFPKQSSTLNGDGEELVNKRRYIVYSFRLYVRTLHAATSMDVGSHLGHL